MLSTQEIPPRKIKIMLVDDSAILLREAVGFLSQRPGLEIVEAVPKAANALAQTELHTPDIVLLDITTSGIQGLRTIQELHAVYPSLPIIVLDEIDMESVKRIALARGAVSFVPKQTVMTQLFPAILSGVGYKNINL